VTDGSRLFRDISSGVDLSFLGMDMTRTPNAIAFGEVGADGVKSTGDLVAAIPYFITILVVMGTAYYQQKQTMSRNTSSQPQPGQAVMKIFPFFFGFISFNMPAGLVVYFAASQIFRIGQQGLIINLDEKKAATAAVQAKEAKKNKPAAEPTPDSGTGGATTATPGPKRRPQGSKKKRGNKRRRS